MVGFLVRTGDIHSQSCGFVLKDVQERKTPMPHPASPAKASATWIQLPKSFVMENRSPRMIFPRVRKLTGKPAFPTGADCECKARRIHVAYDSDLPDSTAESTTFRNQSDLLLRDLAIAACISFISGGVNRAASCFPLAFCVPSFGRPTFFFIIFGNKMRFGASSERSGRTRCVRAFTAMSGRSLRWTPKRS